MNLTTRSAVAIACTIAIAVLGSRAQAGEIDFEGLDEGQVIDEVSNGEGANGLPSGEVDVFGFNPAFGLSTNAAIVFDSACLPGGDPDDCTGDDADLGTPNETCPGNGPGSGEGGECPGPFQNDTPHGNVAIIAENLTDGNNDDLVDDPDDADRRGQYIEFDFDDLAGNSVTVNSFTYVDNDEGEFGAQAEFFGPGTLNPSVIGLADVGDNGVNTVNAGIEGVTRLRIVLNGSGSVPLVVINEEIEERTCWVTTGGFNQGEVVNTSGKKVCTFGGNVGPPPSGAFEVNWHRGPFADSKFHTNDIEVVTCEDRSETGPGQPGGKKGLVEDTLLFECTGKFNKERGFTCEGFLLDGGEPAGKKGNDPDEISFIVRNSSGTEVARCEGILSGGNVQIHPPVGNN